MIHLTMHCNADPTPNFIYAYPSISGTCHDWRHQYVSFSIHCLGSHNPVSHATGTLTECVVASFPPSLFLTDPLASAPGTIRGDFCIVVGKNVIHGTHTPPLSRTSSNVSSASQIHRAASYASSYRNFVPLLSIRLRFIIPLWMAPFTGSDSDESAAREIDMWFKPEELSTYESCVAPHLYE